MNLKNLFDWLLLVVVVRFFYHYWLFIKKVTKIDK